MLLFHSSDETARAGWQSGFFYADGTLKASLGVVRDTLEAIASGTLGKCPVPIKPVVAFVPGDRRISLRCDRECVYHARLTRLPAGSVTARRTGRAAAGRRVAFTLGVRVAPGRYQLSVSFVHATRPGKAVAVSSVPFVVHSPAPSASRLRR